MIEPENRSKLSSSNSKMTLDPSKLCDPEDHLSLCSLVSLLQNEEVDLEDS